MICMGFEPKGCKTVSGNGSNELWRLLFVLHSLFSLNAIAAVEVRTDLLKELLHLLTYLHV